MSKESRSLRREARWATVVAGCAWALAAAAQSATPADSDAPPAVPGQVMSDVQPLPAEVRDSHGAVVIDGAPVRAQRKLPRPAAPEPPARIGRETHTVLERNRDWDDVRNADAQEQVPPGEASGAGPGPR